MAKKVANKNAMGIMPSKDFLAQLARLTAANDHGKVYEKIAQWASFETSAKCDEYAWFRMFLWMFRAMNRAHEEVGHFPYGDLRATVGKEMDKLIVRTFGRKALDLITAAT